jgi:hypothetical protein
MGCWVSIDEVMVHVWHTPVPHETVRVYLSEQRKCYFCKKGFGHSFARVSTCTTCSLLAHSKCMDEWTLIRRVCPVCYPD